MNITNIERSWRLFVEPVMVVAGGMLGMLVASQVLMAKPVLAGAGQVVGLACGGLAVAGLIWMAWRAWLLWRWEIGDLDGACYNCAGVLSHHKGRHGYYSKCRMCGSKREGHH